MSVLARWARQAPAGLVVALLVAPPAAWAAPELTFGSDAVEVAGVTAGGEVVLVGIRREWTGRSTRIRETAEVLTAGADGTARHELAAGEQIPELSLWLVVDLETGEAAVASPAGFEARAIEFPGRAPDGAGGPGALRRLDLEGRFFRTVWVRPGNEAATRGAWSAGVGDGGELDDDGPANGRMGFDVARMGPLGESPPAPEDLAAGDVLALIDAETLEYFLTTLPGAAQGGN